MRGLRSDITSASAPFVGTGLTGLDVTTTACSFASWLRVDAGDCDLFAQAQFSGSAGSAQLLNGICIGARASGEMRLFVCDASSQTNNQSGAAFLLRGVWAHYAVTWDGTTLRFYRSGVLHSTAAQGGTPTTAGTRTTAALFNSTQPAGAYFDTRWFPNVVLRPADVRACMDPRKTVAGAKGRWFRHWGPTGSSVTILDESGNGNHLVTSTNPVRSQTIEAPPFVSILASTQRRTRHLRGVRAPVVAGSTIPATMATAVWSAASPSVVLSATSGFLAIAGIAVPVLEGQAVERIDWRGQSYRAFAGNLRAMVRPDKCVWQVTTGLLTLNEAINLKLAVASGAHVACAGVGLPGTVTCEVTVGDGAYINTGSSADGTGVLRSLVLTLRQVS